MAPTLFASRNALPPKGANLPWGGPAEDCAINPEHITALILAGGRGTRMGGVDKGLQPFNGVPLALHTLQRLQQGGGAGRIVINANRNLPAYEAFGVPVWPDGMADYPGPLAGFLTGLEHCESAFLLTVPCDTPRLPLDLASRLAQVLAAEQADIAMASAPETGKDGQIEMRTQPVFCLLRVSLRDSLKQFTQQHTARVPFNQPGDDVHAFYNANSLVELRQLEDSKP
jgi:molybdopterin-guanine dinucleotide biosynthesis protein A